jgi:hypothetical protein
MLDLTTLELIPRELFLLELSALPKTIAIGCKTAEAGYHNSNPFGVRWGKTLREIECATKPEVQGLRPLARADCQVW